MRPSRTALLASSALLTPKFATLILGVIVLVFSAAPFAAAQSSLTGSVVLPGHRPAWAVPQNSQGAVPGDTMLEHSTVVLKRSPQQQQAFETFLQQLQDRSSSNYHHFLTPVQMGEKFGAPQESIDAVTGWLSAQGLRVDSVSNSRTLINFSGTAALVGSAFSTEMRYYEVDGEQRIATAADPQIPAALGGVIQSVSGLHTIKNRSYHQAVPAQKLKEGGFTSPDLTFCNPTCVNFIMPADFATIYDLNGLTVDGTGQNIGIIGRSRVYDPDIENFESLSGLAKKDPTVIIPTDGVDPGPAAGPGGNASGDQQEATLDVMRAGSVATGATVDLIVSASSQTEDGIGIAAQYAVDNNPVPIQTMNISFGLCEADVALSDVQFWDTLFSQAVGEGISVFVSAGDSGAAGCDRSFEPPPTHQSLSTNYICASSYSTCVGGTEFNDVPAATYWNQNPVQAPPYESALGPIPEGAWNEPFNLNGNGTTWVAAGGGGFSVFIPTPTWQTGTGVPGTQGRYTPDIAFSSSGHDGYLGCLAAGGGDCVVQGGGFSFEYFFGTSAAAPDMAGITALLNQKIGSSQGELNQRLYQLAVTPANLVFNDVTVATSGVSPCVVTSASMCNNSTAGPTGVTGGLAGYLVTAGYDEATGLGSINGSSLLANWVPAGTSPTSTTLTTSGTPAIQGATVTFTATVTYTGSNPPTGTVTFNDGTMQIGTGTLNGSQVATLATKTLAVGTHSITAVYAGDTNNAGSTSAPVSQVITAITTTTTLAASPNPVGYGALVTLTATVATTGSIKPTGSVTFYNGGTLLGMANLNGSLVATFITGPTQLAVGSNSLTAVYAGDANNSGSTSGIVTETVNAPSFTVTNTGSNSSTVVAGQQGTGYAFSVAPASPATNFGAPVTLSCSNFNPSDPTLTATSCTFSGTGIVNNIIPATNGLTQVTLQIATAGPGPATPGAGRGAGQRRRADNRSPWLPLALPLAGIVMAGFAGRKVSRHSTAAGLFVALMLLGILIACGGGSSTPPIVVTTLSSNPTLYPNNTGWAPQTSNVSATLNNTTNTNVTWGLSTSTPGVSCTAPSNPCGSFASTTNPTTYTSPTVAAGLPTSVAIMATSVADPTKVGSTQETIKPATIPERTYNITVTVTDPVALPTTQQITTYTMTVQ